MADLITSIILMLASIFIFQQSLSMPVPQKFVTAPGFFPAVIAVVLFILSSSLMIKSIRKKSIKFSKAKWLKMIKDQETIRVFIIIGCLIMYFFVLIPLIGFIISTWIFLVVFTAIFKEVKLKWIILSSTLTTALVYVVFFMALKLPLPQ